MVHFIFSSHNHFDAEQLCADMDRAGLNVSRATVYRTLTKLVDAGLLRSLQVGPRVVYEHDYGYPQHEHLYCQHCGKMIEFLSPELEAVFEEVCRQHQFQPSSHSLVIRGTCAECNRSRVTKRRLDLV
jgi:Fur family ferric uptake transcriptional regulator